MAGGGVNAVFSLSSVAVVPLWFLMIVLPTWRGTMRIVSAPWAYAPLTVVYAALVLPRFGEVAAVVVTRPGPETVGALLATPAGATIAWVHFLAFDVFVGRWAYLDSRERGVRPLVMAPILLLTFLFGPMGLLSYLVARWFTRPRVPVPGRSQDSTELADQPPPTGLPR
jgi:hypothetical protein